jgi:hypothetical protein
MPEIRMLEKSAYSFLKIGVSAKAQAMGGAYAGLADDIGGLYYNPAGLTAPSYILQKQLYLMMNTARVKKSIRKLK